MKISNLRRHKAEGRPIFVTFSTLKKKTILKNPKIANVVQQVLLALEKERKLKLLEYVIMPDHIHLLISERGGYSFENILRLFKTKSSKEINKIRNTKGRNWERRYFDRIIRSEDEYRKAIKYIRYNPIKKGLVESSSDYLFSSAFGKELEDI